MLLEFIMNGAWPSIREGHWEPVKNQTGMEEDNYAKSDHLKRHSVDRSSLVWCTQITAIEIKLFPQEERNWTNYEISLRSSLPHSCNLAADDDDTAVAQFPHLRQTKHSSDLP